MSSFEIGARHRETGTNTQFQYDTVAFSEYVESSRRMIAGARLDLSENARAESVIDANSPFELAPAPSCPQGNSHVFAKGVLLIHGLTDSPFMTRDIARVLNERCFLVRAILLTGHGTVPGDLLNVDHDAWVRETRWAVQGLVDTVDTAYLAGFSTGGILSLQAALTDRRIRALLLFAPALKIKNSFAFLSGVAAGLMPWLEMGPDEDYAKYESFSSNAAAQVYRLTQELLALRSTTRLSVPMFVAMSADDAAADAEETLKYFQSQSHASSRLILYANQRPDTGDGRVRFVPAAYAQDGILEQSHISVGIAPDNPHYGRAGDYRNCKHYLTSAAKWRACKDAAQIVMGEWDVAKPRGTIFARVTYNPDFAHLTDEIGAFLDQAEESGEFPDAPAAQFINDVSRLNPTPVADILRLHEVAELRDALAQARQRRLKVSIAGARHSQGGHAFYDGALVLDMTGFNRVLGLDPERKVVRVESGATWRQIQDYANAYGLAVKVMQSSNIFTVGGSLSVNAHGRDPNFGPIIQTVESFRLLQADGNVINVSRTENAELFGLAIGGFGLFGVILDVDLSLTDNAILRKTTVRMDYSAYPEHFAQQVKDRPGIGLHYARLSNVPDTYLREMYATTLVADPPAGIDVDRVKRLDAEEPVVVPKVFFDLARHSDWGKNLSWYLQKTVVDPAGATEWISRNNAMRPAVEFLEYNSPADTDILQEYFLPVERFVEFVDGMRALFQRRRVNLLNVTVRYVPKDQSAFLSYAGRDSFAFVLYINQGLSAGGVREAQTWTQELVDLCLGQGGTYYLPYQNYPERGQLLRSYPAFDAFVNRKRVYDGAELFMNKFYAAYAQPLDLASRSREDLESAPSPDRFAVGDGH